MFDALHAFGKNDRQKASNYLALCIVLGGLFLGSVFVDIGQLMLGRGFSQSAVREHQVLEQNGKTWVAFRDPRVDLVLLTDTTCSYCDTDEALVWLRRVIPTLSVSLVEADSEAGKSLISQYNLRAVPAFIFTDTITKTAFYTQAPSLFQAVGSNYLLDMEAIGLPAGRQLSIPTISPESVVLGNREAALKVVLYSDFQCQFCGAFHKNQIKKLLSEYGDRATFVFKALPLDDHPQAPLLAQASLCAHAQGKYFDYASVLFGKHRELATRPNTKQELKNISWAAKLNWMSFSDCIDHDRFKEQVEAEANEARTLGITGTPALFIGDRLVSGAGEYEMLRQMMEEALSQAR